MRDPPIRAMMGSSAHDPCEDGSAVETVLIVDDHAGFRSLARRLLAAAGFDVVGGGRGRGESP
jgi:hypothetical protein